LAAIEEWAHRRQKRALERGDQDGVRRAGNTEIDASMRARGLIAAGSYDDHE
jgi:hypothetical protein